MSPDLPIYGRLIGLAIFGAFVGLLALMGLAANLTGRLPLAGNAAKFQRSVSLKCTDRRPSQLYLNGPSP